MPTFKHLASIYWQSKETCNHLLLWWWLYKWSWFTELYTPEHIVEQYDVIVITFNYRLGALGFLDWSYFNAHYDKNNGLSDQIAVLKWVAHFIKYFGGDPDNVTLWGQSAGSMSIQALMRNHNLTTIIIK